MSQASAAPPENSQVQLRQDPIISRIHACRECQQPMGSFRVFEATTPGKQHLRGRIVQTCTDGPCHWTFFHTQVSYQFEDAENLIRRILARENRAPISPDILNAPLRTVNTIAPVGQGPQICPGACTTKTGGKSRGSQMCIELKCKSCCTEAAALATENGTSRDPCKNHKIPIVYSRIQPPPFPAPPVLPPIPVLPTPAPLPVLSDQTHIHIPEPQTQITAAPGQMHPTTFPSSQLSTQPAVQQSAGSANRKPRSTPLVLPLGPNWVNSMSDAEIERKREEELKIRRIRIDEQLRRTVDLLIYFKANTSPVTFPWYVDTYPKLKLEDVPRLVVDLKLDSKSLFDHFSNGRWETVSLTSILTVEKGHSVILRARPSLIEELPLAECPNIEYALSLLPQTRKRPGDNTLVSPVKKILWPSEPEILDMSLGSQPPKLTGVNSTTNSVAQPQMFPKPSQTMPLTPLAMLSDDMDAPADAVHNILDCSIFAWDEGWTKIKEMQDNDPTITEASAFPNVFGLKYVKSTVSSYKKIWKNAPDALKKQFIQYGNIKRGCWLNFNANIRKHGLVRSTVTNSRASSVDTVLAAPATPSFRQAPLPFPMDVNAILKSTVIKNEPANECSQALQDLLQAALALAECQEEQHAPSNEPEDPSTLCSFCDRKLPNPPSAKLLRMRKDLEIVTWHDPSPDNSLHHSARGFQVYITYCTRHIFESDLLPQAIGNHWPLSPNFEILYDRVVRQFLALKGIAQSGTNEFLILACEYYKSARRDVSLAEQYSAGRFLESSAGYYGEPGFQIILSALHELFPRESVNLVHIHPLKYEVYLQEVLVYEAATRIIQQDLELSYERAIDTFRESCAFGVHMHDSDDPEIDIHIQKAAQRATKSIMHTASVHRSWIASNSELSIDKWVESQKETDEHLRIKQEELDKMYDDPFANEEEGTEQLTMAGAGVKDDPFDLTLDD